MTGIRRADVISMPVGGRIGKRRMSPTGFLFLEHLSFEIVQFQKGQTLPSFRLKSVVFRLIWLWWPIRALIRLDLIVNIISIKLTIRRGRSGRSARRRGRRKLPRHARQPKADRIYTLSMSCIGNILRFVLDGVFMGPVRRRFGPSAFVSVAGLLRGRVCFAMGGAIAFPSGREAPVLTPVGRTVANGRRVRS